MQIFHSFSELSSLPCPVHWAMGFFDGVHLGHKRVIESASSPGALRGVLTFHPHPLAILRPGCEPKLITPSPDFKAHLLAKAGADVLLVLPFTRQLAEMSPEAFLDTLCSSSIVKGISVGSNWHFGKGGSGNADFLSRISVKYGFNACINSLLTLEDDTVCSSRIRELLSEGNIAKANQMLGRPFCISGTVEHGQKLARTLGFPTANITLPPCSALPRPGVYEVQCRINSELKYGIANIGLRPTICENYKPTRLEAHFPGWSGDLYGRELHVELLNFLRPEKKFDGIDSLKTQIEQDIASATSHKQ